MEIHGKKEAPEWTDLESQLTHLCKEIRSKASGFIIPLNNLYKTVLNFEKGFDESIFTSYIEIKLK